MFVSLSLRFGSCHETMWIFTSVRSGEFLMKTGQWRLVGCNEAVKPTGFESNGLSVSVIPVHGENFFSFVICNGPLQNWQRKCFDSNSISQIFFESPAWRMHANFENCFILVFFTSLFYLYFSQLLSGFKVCWLGKSGIHGAEIKICWSLKFCERERGGTL